MATHTKRATVYFDPDLHNALKLKALATSRFMTDLVNQAVRQALAKDAEDIAAFEQKENEPLVSYDHDQMNNEIKQNTKYTFSRRRNR